MDFISRESVDFKTLKHKIILLFKKTHLIDMVVELRRLHNDELLEVMRNEFIGQSIMKKLHIVMTLIVALAGKWQIVLKTTQR